jgi:hypothetical protein
MKTFKALYRKKNGQFRSMHFTKLKNLPPQLVPAKIRKSKNANLSKGMEVVWDLEAQDFRIFNWNTVVGEVKKQDELFVL